MLPVDDLFVIPEAELTYRSSRSSGPGGQHVNKVETRITVLFDVGQSGVLSDEQKETLRQKLATRINKEGVMRVVSQKHRTQRANREAAREKLARLVAGALRPKRKRQRTRTPAKAKRRRLEDKKRRSELKRQRRTIHDT